MTSFLKKAFLFMMSLSPIALNVYAFPDGYGFRFFIHLKKLDKNKENVNVYQDFSDFKKDA